ncbi:hypothetical protein EKH77_14040 [Streptomyces luteoverticillatus]|uniref:Uncharacterized protein n=1 Tax=Streptomyces luteoverticillatus TaxID=66425 RepID=A0A3Q9FZP0_STRLT|nr:hypothetical protein EKH77_14040 [Streptomyces luteoverticillatus]
MVIFAASPRRRTRSQQGGRAPRAAAGGRGALTNGTPRAILRTRPTDAPPHRSSVRGMDRRRSGKYRHALPAHGLRRAGRQAMRNNRIPEGEIGIAPVSGNPLWTSVGQVATLTLCAAC